MIYYDDGHVVIRELRESDAEYFAKEEQAQGWNTTPDKFFMRLRDRQEKGNIPMVAEYDGTPAGYINVYRDSCWGPFGGKGLPEIVDFGVLIKYRNRGIGSKLMDAAEKIASEYSDTVYLSVGLHNAYGSAQRMYVKRGYIPDGTGAWYKDKVCTPYDTIYTVDDDLVLYMSKKLR
ncbi:MAG: GNAT family N-acetyltransferase [Ruminococcus sp.]|nr:GNAT family N-acetyltransferase [Ruminococcus sp.]